MNLKLSCPRDQKVIELKCINPIPAGVLENQDMLGRGQFEPPLQIPCFMSKYDK